MPSSSESDSSSDDEQTKKRFQIVCRSSQMVLDVEKSSGSEGARVILYESKSRRNKNQLWFVDKDGYVKSCKSKMTIFAEDTHQALRTSKKVDDPKGQWRIEGSRIVNRKGLCLDTIKKSTAKGAEICSNHQDGSFSQEWDIKYV